MNAHSPLKPVLVSFILAASLLCSSRIFGQEKADTVKTGIYITSIHDIDFKQKEYSIIFWLWLKYKNKDFDFLHNLEIPQAKTFTTSFSTVDSSNGQIYMIMKLQCVMKDSWRISNFPFDRQALRLSIENSQFDSKALVFVADTTGDQYDKRFTLRGWDIDSLNISTGKKIYETNFGDETIPPHTEYSNFKVKISINRAALGLFWKLFLGMYVAFLIAYVCFYIDEHSIDSRFGLGVGAIFAVIGNKYIVDSALPESVTYTLVDTLHGITLFFILAIITCNVYFIKLIRNGNTKAYKFNMYAAQAILIIYTLLNVWFIYKATRG